MPKNYLKICDKKHKFVGFVSIKENTFKINLTCPKYPLADDIHLEVFDVVQQIPMDLPPHREETVESYSHRLEVYLRELKSKDKDLVSDIFQRVEYFDRILDELDLLESSGHTIAMNDICSKIRISGIAGNPRHFIEVDVVTDKAQVKVVNHSLPDIPGESFWKISTIDKLLDSFKALLGQMSEFYENLHTIDELCFVVGPAEITTKTTFRIIKFSEKIFLRIRINPLIPSQVDLNFIGPIAQVEPLRVIYNEKIGNWDPEVNVYQNLLRMYDLIYFPMRENDQETPCNICFDFLQGSSIPIISCDNDKCNVIFHVQCLEQYFASAPKGKTKTMFSLFMGECPFCRQKLTTFLDYVSKEEKEKE